MEIRQRLLTSIILFFLIIIPDTSFAFVNKKTDFISSILPEIEMAKDRVGGIADKIPASLVLAQAIHESGWGTSNFAKDRKNLFGVKTVKVIRKNKSVRKVMVYKSFNRVGEGIRYYLSNYASNDDYEELRRYVSKGSGTHTLIKHLGNYAQDPEYAGKLKKIIDDNHLLKFDSWFKGVRQKCLTPFNL